MKSIRFCYRKLFSPIRNNAPQFMISYSNDMIFSTEEPLTHLKENSSALRPRGGSNLQSRVIYPISKIHDFLISSSRIKNNVVLLLMSQYRFWKKRINGEW